MINKQPDTDKQDQATSTPYRGAYRAELDNDEENTELEADDENSDPSDEEATQEDQEAENNEQDDAQDPEQETYKKRYADLRRYHQKVTNSLKEELEQLKSKVNVVAPTLKPPKTKEEYEAWKAKFPDVAALVETGAAMAATPTILALQDKVERIEKDNRKLAQREAEAKLLVKHPDFANIRESDDFHEWAEQQKPHIRAWLYNNYTDADLAARAIDLYKLDRGFIGPKTEQTRSLKADPKSAAMLTKTSNKTEPKQQGKKMWKLSEIDKLDTRTFEKYEKEIDQARREGRIENDMVK